MATMSPGMNDAELRYLSKIEIGAAMSIETNNSQTIGSTEPRDETQSAGG
jgi:hypothetical protein